MKKHLFSVGILMMLSASIMARNFYVSTSGNDGNNGRSTGAPWRTLSKVSSTTFIAGDVIHFKRGNSFTGQLSIKGNGTSSNYIKFTAYGSGALPIINNTKSINGKSWTTVKSNVYKTYLSDNPTRLKINGTEVMDAQWNDAAAALELGNYYPSQARWYFTTHRKNPGDIYLYSTTHPSSLNLTVPLSRYAVSMSGNQYIQLKDLKIVGGTLCGVWLFNADHIRLNGLDVGEFGGDGIYLESSGSSSIVDVIVDNCNIDSRYNFDYSNCPVKTTGYDPSERGPREGFVGRSSYNIQIKNSTFRNYSHASINLFADNSNGLQPCRNYKIYNNTILNTLAYGGRFALDGARVYNNEIYNNTLINLATPSQINGHDNHIHHNIFKGTKSTKLLNYHSGYGILMQGWNSAVYNNVIEHNIFEDNESAGVSIAANGSHNVYNNVVRNNIFINNGKAVSHLSKVSFRTKLKEAAIHLWANGQFGSTNSAKIANNTFENNLFYNAGATARVMMAGTRLSTAGFNAKNGTNSQLIRSNITGNPKFVSTTDYSLQSTSPAIDAGRTPVATKDRANKTIPYNNTTPDIGAYEYQGGGSGCSNTLNVQNITACDTYTWPVNNQTYTTSNTYNHVTTKADGCTHTERLILVIDNNCATGLAYLEAECPTTKGSYWTESNSSATSGGKYLKAKNSFWNTGAALGNGTKTVVKYTFNVAAAGNYYHNARVRTPNGGDSYWYRVNNGSWQVWHMGNQSNYTWIQNGAKVALVSGSNTFEVSIREGSLQLDKFAFLLTAAKPTGMGDAGINCGPCINTTNTVNHTACNTYTWPVNNQTYTNSNTYSSVATLPSGCTHTEILVLTIDNCPITASDYLEAECPTSQGANWSVQNNSSLSGGKFLKAKNSYWNTGSALGKGIINVATYTFDVNAAGNYYHNARVRTPNGGDSYYYRVNNGTWKEWHMGNRSSFTWIQNGFKLPLVSGINTFEIALREGSLEIDKFAFLLSATKPSGNVGTATNCASARPALVQENINTEIQVYPNPIYNIANVDMGTVTFIRKLTLMDINGKTIVVKNIMEEAMSSSINIPNIDKGVYFIKIETDTEVIMKKVVKF